MIVQRLVDLLIFSAMESMAINAKLHDTYRLLIKKKLYIRCMKVYPELFKGKKQVLLGQQAEPFIWNSIIEGDEMCQESLKELAKQKQQANDFMTQEGVKI